MKRIIITLLLIVASSIALNAQSQLYGWGDNTYGQLGFGVDNWSPKQISIGISWLSTSRRCCHTIAIKSDSTLWAWGRNDDGQLGDGTTTNRPSPTQIGTGTNWASISSGRSHTVAIKSNGTLWAWGNNEDGELGDGTTTNRTSPTQIGSATNWITVACGESHTIAIKSDGTLWAWGSNIFGSIGDGTTIDRTNPVQIGTDTDWVSVSGGYNTIAIKRNGTLWAWGYNGYGVLGDGTTTNRTSPTQIGTDTNWASVSGGYDHTIATKTDGTLWAWGNNEFGQLGDGTTINRTTPIQIGTDTNWNLVLSCYFISIATKTDGTLWAWGYNRFGVLGDGTTTNRTSPVQIGTNTNWSKISGSTAIKTDGTLWAWGSNEYGELGDGTTIDITNPTKIGDIANWTEVSCGANHTIALKNDKTLWAWGGNEYGQIGDGTTADKSKPVQIGVGTYWTSIASGVYYTTAIKSDGTLWAWGRKEFNPISDSNNIAKLYTTPKQIGIDNNWKSVSCGSYNIVAIKTNGTLWAWEIRDSIPIQIGTDSNWTSVSCGNDHNVALKINGTLWAWGGNNYGQLGDGTTIYKSIPTQIGIDNNWKSVSCGSHTVGIKADGTLWAWGYNNIGQLGDNTTTNKTSPTLISSETNWAKVSCGYDRTTAIKLDGTLWAWGSNYSGELGDGTKINKTIPTLISTETNWSNVSSGSSHTIALALGNICKLEVSYPNSANAALYKDFILEVTTNKGTSYKRNTTLNSSYTISGFSVKDTCTVRLLNKYNDTLGIIKNIAMKAGINVVQFASLLTPYTVSFKAKDPKGNTLNPNISVKWFDDSSKFLLSADSIKSVIANKRLKYLIEPNKNFKHSLSFPDTLEYIVQNGLNNITVRLDSLRQITISGTIRDAKDSSTIKKATVSISQTIGVQNSENQLVKTDSNGVFSAKIYTDSADISISYNGYLNKSISIDTISTNRNLGNIYLSEINGATLDLRMSYTYAFKVGDSLLKNDYYTNWQDLDFEIFNISKNKAIKDYQLQFPTFVILDTNTAIKDSIRIIATNRSNEFKSKSGAARLDSNLYANIQLDFIQNGSVKLSYSSTGNDNDVALVYDANSKLIKQYNYSRNGFVQTDALPQGTYKIVSMGYSDFFNDIQDINDLSASGLVVNTDYLLNQVTVSEGIIAEQSVGEIPFFDESKLYYTSTGTLVSVNKTEAVVGSYFALKTRLNFKSEYSTHVSNIKLIYNLPANCSFIPGSAMIGRNTDVVYTDNQGLITIPLSNGYLYSDEVRFCVISTVSGKYKINAFVQFDINGKTIKQPLGVTAIEATDIDISVPKETAQKTISTLGIVFPNSNVIVYDNEVEVGRTKALANGSWKLNFELYEPYSYSYHDVYAKITTPLGLEMKTLTKSITYDANKIDISKVTMIYNNTSIEFDFIHPTTKGSTYTFVPSRQDFTFNIDFTQNDPEKITDVILNAITAKGKEFPLKATYDQTAKCWIATGKFDSYNLPVNVSVGYNAESKIDINNRIDSYLNASINRFYLDVTNEQSNFLQYSFLSKKGNLNIYYSLITLPITAKESLISNLNYKDGDSLWLGSHCLLFSDISGLIQQYFSNDSIYIISSLAYPNHSFLEYIKNNYIDGNLGKKKNDNTIQAMEIPRPENPLQRFNAGPFTTYINMAQRKWDCAEQNGGDEIVQEQLAEAVRGLLNSVGVGNVMNALGGGANFINVAVKASIQQHHDVPKNINDWTDIIEGFFGSVADVKNEYDSITNTNINSLNNIDIAAKHWIQVIENAPYYCNNDNGNSETPSNSPNTIPQIDPSGYVYEAVSSNLLQGVTTTCYYKTQEEDMYGDKHEVVKLWDAENYEQQNPLTTDENGFYAWDVPQGQWQVKYEKDGYDTEYSEWLPVPPPQLDVNQGMISAVAPEVKSAIGYESKIKVEFTKYMQIDSLNTNNISLVNKKDSLLKGTIILTNQEAAPRNTGLTYASKFNYVPKNALAVGDTVFLKINSEVKSYANIPMDNDYQQMIIIRAEPKTIEAPKVINLASNGKNSVTVKVTPAHAAAGQKLKAKSGSNALVSITPNEVTLNSTGTAQFEVSAHLAGTTYLTFTLDEAELRAETKVNIGMPIPKLTMPKASIDSGTTVRAGTELVLTSREFDSKIYYTLDGTSPVTSSSRILYDNPINMNKNTVVKAYNLKDGFTNSDIAIFGYKVINVYNITTTVNPDTAGTVTGAGEYYENQKVELILKKNKDFVFKNWTIDNQEVSTDTIYTFNATKNCNVVANFIGAVNSTSLLSPINNAYRITLKPEFTWQSVQEAEHYELQIAEDPYFVHKIIDTNLLTTKYLIPNDLSKNTTYFWKVRVWSKNNSSSWSPTWSFTTEDPADVEESKSIFSISPQPVRDEAIVTFNLNNINSGISIELYDIKGTQTAEYKFTSLSEGSNKLRLDLSNIPSGMYNVIIKIGADIHRTKLMKIE